MQRAALTVFRAALAVGLLAAMVVLWRDGESDATARIEFIRGGRAAASRVLGRWFGDGAKISPLVVAE